MNHRRLALRRGARAAMPLGAAALPFGLVYGVTVVDSTVPTWVGVAGSWIVLAGAAQLSLVELMEADAAWPLAVGTALVINLRFVLYSVALAPAFGEFPRRWRWSLPYLMTDQAAVLALDHQRTDADPVRRRWFFLGAGLLFASGWWVGTVAGAMVGGILPPAIEIEFAVPAMFIALLVPTVVDAPAIATAVAAASATLLAAPAPSGLDILVGACVGLVVGRSVLALSARR